MTWLTGARPILHRPGTSRIGYPEQRSHGGRRVGPEDGNVDPARSFDRVVVQCTVIWLSVSDDRRFASARVPSL
eukprot:9000135-Pyramimonas_sp.AAC.1